MLYTPFNGLAKFKERCRQFEEPREPLPMSVPIEKVVIVPRSGLYDIWKRSTDLAVNKCVDIGFTYAEAVEFVKTRLKTKVDVEYKVVVFYDIVAQENELAKSPLWNPPEIEKEGGSHTEGNHSQVVWRD